MEPTTQVTKDIVALRMNRGDFFVCGNSWSKFHSAYPLDAHNLHILKMYIPNVRINDDQSLD